MKKSLRVLITGASSGLGRAMALELAAEGVCLALTARRSEKLEETAEAARRLGAETLSLVGGASDHETVRRHYAAIRERWSGLDWAILNAGFNEGMSAAHYSAMSYLGKFSRPTSSGPRNRIEAVLPDMLRAKSGTIAGISNLAAMRGIPRLGPYCSSKAALRLLLESLRVELRRTGVSVVTVCPGWVKSEMTARHDPRTMPFPLGNQGRARRIIKGIRRKQSLVHFPWQGQSLAAVHLGPNTPNFFYDWFADKFLGHHHKAESNE